ncbi:MAG: hypothetical protein WEA34_04690, partial [Gemmatimonadota bacterium]
MNNHSAEPRPPTDSGVIEYVVKPDGTVVEIRGIWDDFARTNGAGGLTIANVVGHDLCDFVSGPATRLVYDALIERVGRTRAPIHFTFRCDAPDVRRHMRMDVMGDGSENVRFSSRIVSEEPRPRQALLSTDVDRSDVTVVMCSWCKRVKQDDNWVEVEEYVESTGLMEEERFPQLSHGLCPECAAKMEALID